MVLFSLEILFPLECTGMSSIGCLELNTNELLIFSGQFTYKHDHSFLIDELVLVRDEDFSTDFEFAYKWRITHKKYK